MADEPAGVDVTADVPAFEDRLVIEFQIYDDIVGLHGLYLDRLVPSDAAGCHGCLPVACRSIVGSLERKAVHSVVSGIVHQSAYHLTLRVAECCSNGMAGRKNSIVKHGNESKVDLVTGTPYPAFSKYVTFLSLAGSVAVHIKSTH